MRSLEFVLCLDPLRIAESFNVRGCQVKSMIAAGKLSQTKRGHSLIKQKLRRFQRRIGGYLKLSRNRTIFCSKGTIVPPDVITTIGPLWPSHKWAIPARTLCFTASIKLPSSAFDMATILRFFEVSKESSDDPGLSQWVQYWFRWFLTTT